MTNPKHADEKDAQAEWRERIGALVMQAMRCTHDGDEFGPRAVCETCFDNTQRIGALIEREVARASTTEETP